MIIFLDNSNDLTGQAFLTPELQMSKPGLENWISGHLGFRLRSASFQSLDSTPPTLSRVSKARSLGWQGQGGLTFRQSSPWPEEEWKRVRLVTQLRNQSEGSRPGWKEAPARTRHGEVGALKAGFGAVCTETSHTPPTRMCTQDRENCAVHTFFF